jgi:hypothetical protein
MTFLFLGSLMAQSIAGRSAFNHDQLKQNEDAVGWGITYWRRVLEPHAPEPALRNY